MWNPNHRRFRPKSEPPSPSLPLSGFEAPRHRTATAPPPPSHASPCSRWPGLNEGGVPRGGLQRQAEPAQEVRQLATNLPGL